MACMKGISMAFRASQMVPAASHAARLFHGSSARWAVTNFQMPAMSPTMTEGGIASWKKKEGESFVQGDVLLEIETDKATIDVEAQEDGIMGKILAPDGTKGVPVGKIIALLAEEGDDISNLELPKEETTPAPKETGNSASSSPPASEPVFTPSEPIHATGAHSYALPEHARPLFPSVHRLLLEHKVTKVEDIKGTGVRGMLTKGDVLTFLGKASGPLGTFKPSISPIEEANQARSKAPSQAAAAAPVPLDGPSIRRLIVSSMLQASIKARNPVPSAIKDADFDSVLADYLPPVSKSTLQTPVTPPAPSKTTNYLDVTITETGLTITVEEARTAFIFSDVFDEYTFHPEPPPRHRLSNSKGKRTERSKRDTKQEVGPSHLGQVGMLDSETESESDEDCNKPHDQQEYQQEDEEEQDMENAAFEIPLTTLIECLNIFGTAGPATGNINTSSGAIDDGERGSGGGRGGRGRGGNRVGQGRGWPNPNEDNSDGENSDHRDRQGANLPMRGLDAYFGNGGSNSKRTSMRLSYPGGGYPLTLIIAEDAAGPTTTCEITTFDPEPQLELEFDTSKTVLRIILKSSWLRDALSELDPSCEKLAFIGNPPISANQQQLPLASDANARQKQKQRSPVMKPMLRIQATGTFGSTEMDYPNDREVLETFECTRNVSFSYRFGHISRTIKALSSSTKTSLRIDEDGLLSLQFLMPSPKPRIAAGRSDAFIEFRCLALDDEI
ncbi:putative pyruvate dehydrogenase protein X component, mitochondrial [Psilocybe cubensis]|uniref:Uncharacterized protein n=2 Tax=Psilocybe cubensis TaxID=181762 RepID=A0A8H7Y5G7_PSICU|nr:putative pyruvate dehydrogenase protein X component, mitochondrial [Psilocybe cubensis]KAH9484080.1 putative pyruvate dehydrogenase protein X component, mitochondrial [Psilocybe cubensis]